MWGRIKIPEQPLFGTNLLYKIQNIKSGMLNVISFKIRLRVQMQLTYCRHTACYSEFSRGARDLAPMWQDLAISLLSFLEHKKEHLKKKLKEENRSTNK